MLEHDILASLSSTASVTKEWYHEGLIRAAKLFLGYQQTTKQELAETKADYYRLLEEYLENKSYTNSDLHYEVYTELLNYHVLKASEATDPTAEYEAILTLSNKYPNDNHPQIDENILAIIYSLADGYYQAKNSAKLVETSELLLSYTKYLGQNESLRLYIPIIFYMTAEVLLCTDSNKDDANYWLNKIQELSCDSTSTTEVDTSICQGTYDSKLTETSKAYLGNTQLLLENDTSTVTVNVCQQ